MNSLSRFAKTMLMPPVSTNAVRVALVVGTCLNLINQGSSIWHGAPVEWGKFLLNYAVPFLVSSYSGAKARLDREE